MAERRGREEDRVQGRRSEEEEGQKVEVVVVWQPGTLHVGTITVKREVEEDGGWLLPWHSGCCINLSLTA